MGLSGALIDPAMGCQAQFTGSLPSMTGDLCQNYDIRHRILKMSVPIMLPQGGRSPIPGFPFFGCIVWDRERACGAKPRGAAEYGGHHEQRKRTGTAGTAINETSQNDYIAAK